MNQNTHATFVKACYKSLYGLALPILLASCGGGGGTTNDTKPTPTPTLSKPDLGNVSAQTYTAGQGITALEFTNSSGGSLLQATGCTVSPKLPAGLVLSKTTNNQTCQITGTPAGEVAADDYTITATNATGSDTTTVSITVSAAVSVNPVSIGKVQLTSSGDPAPLAGDVLTLSFETTGQTNFNPQVRIGGQLAEVDPGDTEGQWVATLAVDTNFQSGDQGFEVVVVVPKGISATEDLSQGITVANVPATPDLDLEDTTAFLLTPILTLETTSYSLAKDQPITPITLINAGGVIAANACSVNTPLPQGLSLAVSGTTTENTCAITGTPEVTSDSTDYIITATNDTGEGVLTITLEVTNTLGAPDLPNTPLTETVTSGDTFPAITVANNGGGELNACVFVDSDGSTKTTLDGLTIAVATNQADCVITGSLTNLGQQPFTVRASNDINSDEARVVFTVNEAIPALTNAPDTTYYAGQAGQVIAFANGGGAPEAGKCVLTDTSPALPADLAVRVSGDGSTCEIFGTPQDASEQTTYTVEATNTRGAVSAEVKITVRDAEATTLVAPAAENLTLIVDQDISGSPIVITNSATATGSAVATCEFVDGASEPAPLTTQTVVGLGISADTTNDTCNISGTPSTLGSRTVYVRATNAEGGLSNVLELEIVINDVAPQITLVTSGPFTAFVNEDLSTTTITFTLAGGAITACVATNLHADLVIDQTTCAITGRPTETGTRTISVTASNSEARVMSNTVEFALTINAQPIPILSVSSASHVFTRNSAIADITISNSVTDSRGVITMCASNPELPTDLSITNSGNTCVLSGTPSVAMVTAQDYDITATSSGGTSVALVLSLKVNPIAPVFTNDNLSRTGTRGQDFTETLTTSSGDNISQCQFVDALNSETIVSATAGLSASPAEPANTECVISGAPSTTATDGSSETFNFFIRASNDGGEDWLSFDFTLNPVAPMLGVAEDSTLTVGSQTNLPITFTNSGGPLSSCAIAPGTPSLASLNLGISVIGNDCVIDDLNNTGPSTTTTNSSYRVRASNDANTSETSWTLTINPANPDLPDSPISAVTVQGSDISPITVTNSGGGQLTACQFVDGDSLATDLGGLNVAVVADNRNDCVITGSLSSAMVTQTFMVRATNITGTDDATITFTVNDAQPALTNAPDTTYYAGQQGQIIVFPNTGGGAPQAGKCVLATSSLALPADLAVRVSNDGSTCEIFGTPQEASEQETYTVEAENITGPSSASVQITVRDAEVATLVAPTNVSVLTLVIGQSNSTNPIVITNSAMAEGGAITACEFVNSASDTTPLADQTVVGLGLSATTNTCNISGTPSTLGSRTVYVRATSAENVPSNVLELELLINDVAPVITLDGSSPFTAFVDEDLSTTNTITFTATGGAITACVATSLHTGLVIDQTTCAITGTPTITEMQTIQVTASNSERRVMSGTVMFDLTVRARGKVVLTNPSNLERTFNEDITSNPISLSNTGTGPGSDIAACEFVNGVSDTTPLADQTVVGLSLVANTTNDTCDITGTPNALGSHTVYVRATSAENVPSDVLELVILVNDVAPVITLDGSSPFTAFVNEDLSTSAATITFTPAGGAITACVATNLHTGLVIDQTTCAITGTPTETGTQTIQVTASNSEGRVMSDTVDFALTVNAQPVPILATPKTNHIFVRNSVITNIVISNSVTNTRGIITACVSDPELPTDLSLTNRNNTCVISGTPSVATVSAQDYAITATSSGGTSVALVLSLKVNPIAPVFTNDNLSRTGTRGQDFTETLTTSSGDNISECQFVDGLSSQTIVSDTKGLSASSANTGCVISGTTSTTATDGNSETFSFFIHAKNDGGEDWLSFDFTLEPEAPTLGGEEDVTLTVDSQENLPITFTNTGGPLSSCVIASGTPSLVSLNLRISVVDDNCVIDSLDNTGPSATTTNSSYTIVATNGGGSDTRTATISIENPQPPMLVDAPAQIYGLDHAFIATIFTNNGGNIQSSGGCAVVSEGGSPSALPDELMLVNTPDNRSCQIQGLATSLTAQETYVIEATNVVGSDRASISIKVVDPVPSITPSPANLRFALFSNIPRTIVFANAGFPITSCTATPELPAGLRIDATTCTIAGYPARATTALFEGSNLSVSTSHMIEASGGTGTDTQTIEIEIYFPLLDEVDFASHPGIVLTVGSTSGLPIVFTNRGGPTLRCMEGAVGDTTLAGLGLALAVSQGTCVLRSLGAGPTRSIAQTNYRFSSSNLEGNRLQFVGIPLTILATAPLPPTLTAPDTSNFNLNTGQSLSVDFTRGGGPTNTCVANPALPRGLSIHPTTCAIRGRAYQAQMQTTHTITAGNAGGSAPAEITLTVMEVVPSFATSVVVNTLTTDLPFEIPNTAGTPQICTAIANGDSPDLASLNLRVLAYNETCTLDSIDGNTIPFDPEFDHTYTLTANNFVGSSLASTLNVNNVPGFNSALDIDTLVFTASLSDPNNPLWFSQTSETQDGMDALENGNISDSSVRNGPRNTTCIQTIIDTAVLGVGRLTYWSRVTTENPHGITGAIYDGLVTYVDDVSVREIGGIEEWTQYTIDFLEVNTSYEVRWCYEKDHNGSNNGDSAWLDNFMYIPTTQ